MGRVEDRTGARLPSPSNRLTLTLEDWSRKPPRSEAWNGDSSGRDPISSSVPVGAVLSGSSLLLCPLGFQLKMFVCTIL